MKKNLVLFIIIAICPVIILLSPLFRMSLKQPKYFPQQFVKAKILEVLSEKVEKDPLYPGFYLGNQCVKVKILEGKYRGKVYEVDNPLSRQHYVFAKKGILAIASVDESSGREIVWLYNYKRDNIIYILGGLFFVLLIGFGRMRGLNSIVSLIFTGVMIIFVMMPLIFQGGNPIGVTIVTASIITIVSFALISGLSRKSLSAILGTVSGVTIAGCISFIVSELAQLSGATMDKGKELIFVAQDYRIQVKGLMFSAILIASLGAVMDVAMQIASSIAELHEVNPHLTRKQLFKSGMNIGRDCMGTMSNTLILAFVGSSLNSIMLIWGYQMSARQFMNIPFICIELIQALSGSIGVVLTFPITALVSVFIIKKLPGISEKAKGKVG